MTLRVLFVQSVRTDESVFGINLKENNFIIFSSMCEVQHNLWKLQVALQPVIKTYANHFPFTVVSLYADRELSKY